MPSFLICQEDWTRTYNAKLPERHEPFRESPNKLDICAQRVILTIL